jgi:hypothetical protein
MLEGCQGLLTTDSLVLGDGLDELRRHRSTRGEVRDVVGSDGRSS